MDTEERVTPSKPTMNNSQRAHIGYIDAECDNLRICQTQPDD